jgi:hypothetical protein
MYKELLTAKVQIAQAIRNCLFPTTPEGHGFVFFAEVFILEKSINHPRIDGTRAQSWAG